MKTILNYLCAIGFFGATVINFMNTQTLGSSLSLMSGTCFIILAVFYK